jgi:hypothetical protein
MAVTSPLLPNPAEVAAERARTDAATTAGGQTLDRRSSPRPPTIGRPADLTGTVAGIVDELNPMFGGIVAATAITECAARAVQDLLGSICLQALPEMAIRLATVRLQSAAADQPAPGSRAG